MSRVGPRPQREWLSSMVNRVVHFDLTMVSSSRRDINGIFLRPLLLFWVSQKFTCLSGDGRLINNRQLRRLCGKAEQPAASQVRTRVMARQSSKVISRRPFRCWVFVAPEQPESSILMGLTSATLGFHTDMSCSLNCSAIYGLGPEFAEYPGCSLFCLVC